MSAEPLTLFEEAATTVQAHAPFLGAETVALDEALGRILAEDVLSDIDMPPFKKSAMDGYACRRSDLDGTLSVVEVIPAGRAPAKRVGAGECAKIMTGAIVPEGADVVIRVEETEAMEGGTIRYTGRKTADNICLQGEDIREGDRVLKRGERIRPQHIGVLAAVGCATPRVARQPRVGVIPTGSELVEADRKPGLSQIRNSNGPQLCEHVRTAGALPFPCGIAPDTEEALGRLVSRAMEQNDVLLLSGGVSMGDYDMVPGVLEKCGVNLLFRKIAVKPGMPTVFGTANGTFCFGLPGNPVSTFVIFEILVKPFLFKLMGHDHRPAIASMRLAKAIRRRKTERDSWTPVQCTGPGTVRPLEYHGSAHLNALTRADGLVCVPRGVDVLAEGDFVNVRLL